MPGSDQSGRIGGSDYARCPDLYDLLRGHRPRYLESGSDQRQCRQLDGCGIARGVTAKFRVDLIASAHVDLPGSRLIAQPILPDNLQLVAIGSWRQSPRVASAASLA
jgi:hypothetical protein